MARGVSVVIRHITRSDGRTANNFKKDVGRISSKCKYKMINARNKIYSKTRGQKTQLDALYKTTSLDLFR